MTHLVLPVVAAFLPPPIAPDSPEAGPDRRADLPFMFIVLCVVCVALLVGEILWPSLSATLGKLDLMLVSQL